MLIVVITAAKNYEISKNVCSIVNISFEKTCLEDVSYRGASLQGDRGIPGLRGERVSNSTHCTIFQFTFW